MDKKSLTHISTEKNRNFAEIIGDLLEISAEQSGLTAVGNALIVDHEYLGAYWSALYSLDADGPLITLAHYPFQSKIEPAEAQIAGRKAFSKLETNHYKLGEFYISSYPIIAEGRNYAYIRVCKTKVSDTSWERVIAKIVQIGLRKQISENHLHTIEELSEYRLNEIAALYEVSLALDNADLSSLYHLIVEKAAGVMNAQACSLLLKNDNSDTLRIAASYGLSAEIAENARVKIGVGIAGKVALDGKPILILNPLDHPDLKNTPLTVRQEISGSMCAPLRDETGSVIGVLSIRRYHPSKLFNEDDLRVFGLFAVQAALAFTNAKLLNGLRKNLDNIKTINAFLDSILKSIHTAVITIDFEGKITSWNRAASKIFGLTAKKAVGLNISSAFSKKYQSDDANKAANLLISNLKSNKSNSHVIKLTGIHGAESELNISSATLVSPLSNQKGLVALIDDVTEKMAMNREMEQMVRLAEIGRMTATIAHEIRNPMTAIKGSAQFLTENMNLPNETQEFITIILDEVNALSSIADEFLEFARPMSLKLESVDSREFIARFEKTFLTLCGKSKVEFICEQTNESPIIKIDRLRMIQVLRNLGMNALQAMINGGTLRLKTAVDSTANEYVISFEDNGVGIDPDHLDKLFAPFFTTKIKGTGLGLSIVKRIIDSHNGKIFVNNLPSGGAEFTIRLPLVCPQV